MRCRILPNSRSNRLMDGINCCVIESIYAGIQGRPITKRRSSNPCEPSFRHKSLPREGENEARDYFFSEAEMKSVFKKQAVILLTDQRDLLFSNCVYIPRGIRFACP